MSLGFQGVPGVPGCPLGAGAHPSVPPSLPQVTGRRLWKNVYDELGGSPGSTSAATCTRRHYERWGRGVCLSFPRVLVFPVPQFPPCPCFPRASVSPGAQRAPRSLRRLVLPYVRHLKGEEDKPLPPSKPRRQYKVSKDDKSKRARKEKGREQVRGPSRGAGSGPRAPGRPSLRNPLGAGQGGMGSVGK